MKRQAIIAGAILVSLALTIMLARSCEQKPAASAPESSPRPARESPAPLPAPQLPSSATAAASATSGTQPTGMLSLTLQFQGERVVEAARQVVPAVAVRPLRAVEGQRGIYHRIVSDTGEVLFENLVPDPRRVPWDTTDDGKHLKGGVATLNDMPLMLRLPAGVRGKLEVYVVKDSSWTRSTLDKTARLMGHFDL